MEVDDGLSYEQAMILALIVGRGLTYRDVAARLDLPNATVLSRIRDALLQLRGQTLGA